MVAKRDIAVIGLAVPLIESGHSAVSHNRVMVPAQDKRPIGEHSFA